MAGNSNALLGLEINRVTFGRLANGERSESVELDGVVYTPQDVLGPDRKGLKITYATDCRPGNQIVNLAKDSDLFVAEGLYGDWEKQKGAAEKGHMVYEEAAKMAAEAGVKELWFTHYSPAMVVPEEYLNRARKVFPNAFCGKNLKKTTLRFAEEDNSTKD